MKSKKWIVISLISLLLIAASVVLLFVWVLPSMKTSKALDAMAEGDSSKVSEVFGEMDDDKKNDLKADVNDIVVYTANQYLEGKKSYEDTFKVLTTVESVRSYRGMTADAFALINLPKLKQLYDETAAAGAGGDHNDAFYAKRDEFRQVYHIQKDENDIGVYYAWDSDVTTKYDDQLQPGLEAYLKEKEAEYDAGQIDVQKLMDYCDAAESLWYSEYAYELDNLLYYDDLIKKEYDEIKAEFDEKEYFDVMEDVDYVESWYSDQKAWEKWEAKYKELKTQAEEEGKKYYIEEAIRLVNEGEKYEAQWLVDEIKENFGQDFDVSAVEAAMKKKEDEKYKEAYLEFMKDWKNNLSRDMSYASMTAGLYFPSEINVDDMGIAYVYLYDFDADGTPELVLRGTEYVAVYTFDGYDADFTGILKPMGLAKAPKVVVCASELLEETGTEAISEAILKFEDRNWKIENIVAYTIYQDEYYYFKGKANGDPEPTDEEGYKNERIFIEAAMEGQFPAGISVDEDWESMINNF